MAELWGHGHPPLASLWLCTRYRPPPKFAPELLFQTDVIAPCKELDHREADLAPFGHKFNPANVITMVEQLRCSLLVMKNPDKPTKPVAAQIAKALAALAPKSPALRKLQSWIRRRRVASGD